MESPTPGQLLMFAVAAAIGWFSYVGFTDGAQALLQNFLIFVAAFSVAWVVRR